MLRLPGALRAVCYVLMGVAAGLLLLPQLVQFAANRNWAGGLGLLGFSVVWLGALHRSARLGVYSAGRRLVVRNRLRTRTLARAEISDVELPSGARGVLGGNALRLVLVDGRRLPLEFSARNPFPGHRERAAAAAQPLRDWLAGTA